MTCSYVFQDFFLKIIQPSWAPLFLRADSQGTVWIGVLNRPKSTLRKSSPMYSCSPEREPVLGCAKGSMASRLVILSLCSVLEIPDLERCNQLWDLSLGRTLTFWSKPRGGPRWSESWCKSPVRKDWENWDFFTLEKRGLQGEQKDSISNYTGSCFEY